MKFQNPSLNSVLKGRKDERTDERTSRNQYAPSFFKVGGIISTNYLNATVPIAAEATQNSSINCTPQPRVPMHTSKYSNFF